MGEDKDLKILFWILQGASAEKARVTISLDNVSWRCLGPSTITLV